MVIIPNYSKKAGLERVHQRDDRTLDFWKSQGSFEVK